MYEHNKHTQATEVSGKEEFLLLTIDLWHLSSPLLKSFKQTEVVSDASLIPDEFPFSQEIPVL